MATYTTNHAPSVLATHSWRTAQNSAAYLFPHLTPAMQILDIGCGPGTITVDLATHIPEGHITGLEYFGDPLPAARSLAASRGIKNITFTTGDIHSLPFADNTFDVIHVHQVLQHIADPVAGLREMRRVAKPGGIVAARESDRFSWFPANSGIEAWVDVTTRVQRAGGGNPHPGSKLHVWAKEAGFELEDHRVKRSAGAWCFSTPAEREYWGGGMARRMEDSGFVEKALAEGVPREELGQIVAGWREWVDDKEGWFGVLHGEILCWK